MPTAAYMIMRSQSSVLVEMNPHEEWTDTAESIDVSWIRLDQMVANTVRTQGLVPVLLRRDYHCITINYSNLVIPSLSISTRFISIK